MLPRDELLKGVENRDELARVIDCANRALKNWQPEFTDFLSPPVLAEVGAIFDRLSELDDCTWGGYPQAERQRLAFFRPEVAIAPEQIPVMVLDIAGNFLFDTANHRDFLGAMLGTGIVREKVGDILVMGERGAQAIVIPEMGDFLTTALTQVRSVPVKTQPIALEELKVRPPQTKTITTVEASLRLDAIASAGFGMSRSKMASAISSGDVRVNWKAVTQSSANVKAGDLIAVRGKGRVEVGAVNVTKKQRYRVDLTRYK